MKRKFVSLIIAMCMVGSIGSMAFASGMYPFVSKPTQSCNLYTTYFYEDLTSVNTLGYYSARYFTGVTAITMNVKLWKTTDQTTGAQAYLYDMTTQSYVSPSNNNVRNDIPKQSDGYAVVYDTYSVNSSHQYCVAIVLNGNAPVAGNVLVTKGN